MFDGLFLKAWPFIVRGYTCWVFLQEQLSQYLRANTALCLIKKDEIAFKLAVSLVKCEFSHSDKVDV